MDQESDIKRLKLLVSTFESEMIQAIKQRNNYMRMVEIYESALEKYANPETHSMDENGFVWSGDYFDYETAQRALTQGRQIKGED